MLGRKLALSLAALTAALVVLEVGVRWRGDDPLLGLRTARAGWRGQVLRASENPDLVYGLREGAHASGPAGEISINQHGFRDRDYPLEKPPGHRRVVVLGDSITFGNGLGQAELFPGYLEELLLTRGQEWDVLNLGVTGYDTAQYVAQLEETGLAFEPDLVVIAHCVNDLGIQSVDLGFLERQSDYSSWVYRLRLAQLVRFEYELRNLSRIDLNDEKVFAERYRSSIEDLSNDADLQARMARLRAGIDEKQSQGMPSFLPWYVSPAHFGRFRGAFRRLANLASERDFQVVVMILPYLDEGHLAAEFDLAYELVEAEAERFGFETCSLTAEVRATDPESWRLAIRPGDRVHYNAQGHGKIAARLLGKMQDMGLLRADSSIGD